MRDDMGSILLCPGYNPRRIIGEIGHGMIRLCVMLVVLCARKVFARLPLPPPPPMPNHCANGMHNTWYQEYTMNKCYCCCQSTQNGGRMDMCAGISYRGCARDASCTNGGGQDQCYVNGGWFTECAHNDLNAVVQWHSTNAAGCQACPVGTYSDGSQPTEAITTKGICCGEYNTGTAFYEPWANAHYNHARKCDSKVPGCCGAADGGGATPSFVNGQCTSCQSKNPLRHFSSELEAACPLSGDFCATYQDQEGQTGCKICSPNDVTKALVDRDGKTCNCLPGYYKDGPAWNYPGGDCIPCPPGKTYNTQGTCTMCGGNTYQPSSASTGGCFPCPPVDSQGNPESGQWLLNKDPNGLNIGCAALNCPVGTYTEDTSAVVTTSPCQPCVRGKYMDESGTPATTCKNCAVGTSTDNQIGQSGCTQCVVGKYANIKGMIACKNCPQGTYSDVIATTVCEICDVRQNHYQNEEGTTVCKTCINGTFTTTNVAGQCADPAARAPPGQYYVWNCECEFYVGQVPSLTSGATTFDPSDTTLYTGVLKSAHVTKEDDCCAKCPFADAEKGICTAAVMDISTLCQTESVCLPNNAPNCWYGDFNTAALSTMTNFASPTATDWTSFVPADMSSAEVIYYAFEPCPLGKYEEGYGYRPSCKDCPVGTFYGGFGATECIGCPSGTVDRSNTTGKTDSTSCEACDGPQEYQANTGQTQCNVCSQPWIQYAPSDDAVQCTQRYDFDVSIDVDSTNSVIEPNSQYQVLKSTITVARIYDKVTQQSIDHYLDDTCDKLSVTNVNENVQNPEDLQIWKAADVSENTPATHFNLFGIADRFETSVDGCEIDFKVMASRTAGPDELGVYYYPKGDHFVMAPPYSLYLDVNITGLPPILELSACAADFNSTLPCCNQSISGTLPYGSCPETYPLCQAFIASPQSAGYCVMNNNTGENVTKTERIWLLTSEQSNHFNFKEVSSIIPDPVCSYESTGMCDFLEGHCTFHNNQTYNGDLNTNSIDTFTNVPLRIRRVNRDCQIPDDGAEFEIKVQPCFIDVDDTYTKCPTPDENYYRKGSVKIVPEHEYVEGIVEEVTILELGRHWLLPTNEAGSKVVGSVDQNLIDLLLKAIGQSDSSKYMNIPSDMAFKVLVGTGCSSETRFQFADSRVKGMGLNEQLDNTKLAGVITPNTAIADATCTMCYGTADALAEVTLQTIADWQGHLSPKCKLSTVQTSYFTSTHSSTDKTKFGTFAEMTRPEQVTAGIYILIPESRIDAANQDFTNKWFEIDPQWRIKIEVTGIAKTPGSGITRNLHGRLLEQNLVDIKYTYATYENHPNLGPLNEADREIADPQNCGNSGSAGCMTQPEPLVITQPSKRTVAQFKNVLGNDDWSCASGGEIYWSSTFADDMSKQVDRCDKHYLIYSDATSIPYYTGYAHNTGFGKDNTDQCSHGTSKGGGGYPFTAEDDLVGMCGANDGEIEMWPFVTWGKYGTEEGTADCGEGMCRWWESKYPNGLGDIGIQCYDS